MIKSNKIKQPVKTNLQRKKAKTKSISYLQTLNIFKHFIQNEKKIKI